MECPPRPRERLAPLGDAIASREYQGTPNADAASNLHSVNGRVVAAVLVPWAHARPAPHGAERLVVESGANLGRKAGRPA